MNTFVIPEDIEFMSRNAEVLEKVLNIIPILGIVVFIVFLMLNLFKNELILKLNKVFLIINSICLVFSLLNVIYSFALAMTYIPGSIEYYYYAKIIYIIPIILSICWIIVFWFCKKVSND